MIRSVDFRTGMGTGVQRQSSQTQQHVMAADAELGVVVIDQLPQFTGIKAAETFF
jgi:hypothetical protein